MTELSSFDFNYACDLALTSTEEANQPVPMGQIVDALRDECLYDKGVLLLAKVGGLPAGVIALFDKSGDSVPHYEVWSLYVKKRHRGAGVANLLLDALIAYRDWEDIPVLCTTTGPVRPLYKSLGFEELNRVNASSVSKIKEALGCHTLETRSAKS